MSKNLFNKIVLFAVVAFILLLVPGAINTPSQSAVRAICTGLAIDSGENGVEVSAQILIPEAGGQYQQKFSIVSQSGETVEDAIELMEYQVGKKVRLAHCGFILLGKSLCEDKDIATVLDYFLRGNNIANNTLLIYTDKEAKDLLKKSSNINTNEVDNLQIIAKYNERYVFSGNANLLSFYHDYLSPQKTSCMAQVTTKSQGETSNSGGGGQSGGESGGGQSSSGNTQEDSVLSDGSVAVFYKGKMTKVLSNDEREQFNWFDKKITGNMIKLSNVSDKVLTNANLGYSVAQKNVRLEFAVINNVPTVKLKLGLGLKLEMIENTNGSLGNMSSYLSEAVKTAMRTKLENDIQNTVKIQQEYGFDIFNFYNSFNIQCHSEWQKYLSTLDAPDDYMKKVEVFIEPDIYSAF